MLLYKHNNGNFLGTNIKKRLNMKIYFKKQFRQSPLNLLRRCGYIPWRDPKTGKKNFIKRLSRAYYPRFHIFAKIDERGNLILDLHLDARRPMHKLGVKSYESAESGVVQEEAERIKEILQKEE